MFSYSFQLDLGTEEKTSTLSLDHKIINLYKTVFFFIPFIQGNGVEIWGYSKVPEQVI